MKNVILKPTLLALSLLLLILPGLQSCKKDKNNAPDLREQLIGEWTINSFTVDGLEMMGLVLNSSTIELEKIKGSSGDYQWLFSYMDGSFTNATGEYEVDEDAAELILDKDTAEESVYKIDIDGDELKLTADFDGQRYKIKLERD